MMKKVLVVVIFICIALGSYAQSNAVKEIEVSRLQKKVSRDIQLVDVRTAKEYQEGHIGNAINIDFNSPDFEANIQKLNKNKKVYVYCRSGKRSAKASKKMTELGFHKIYNLPVGFEGWKKEIKN